MLERALADQNKEDIAQQKLDNHEEGKDAAETVEKNLSIPLSHVHQSQNPAQADGRQKIIDYARQQIGKPYVYGAQSSDGTTSDAFDCSLLSMLSYKSAGININRTADEQAKQFKTLYKDLNQARPGDLVFFSSAKDPNQIDHVGVYQGNNKMIAANQW